MIICDVNVLVAAFRGDHPHHQSAATWLRGARTSKVPLGLADPVVTGFIRIVTSPKIFIEPAPTALAFDFVVALENSPACQRIGTFVETRVFAETCTDANASGNLVPDAYLAALAISLGSALATFDRDFRKFAGLTLVELT